MDADEGKIDRAVRWALGVDSCENKAVVEQMRIRHPAKDNRALAKKVYSATAWKSAAVGVLAGLPSNVFVALPAALGDAAVVLRLQVIAASKVGVIYDPTFLEDDDACWELLIPIFGIGVVGGALRKAGVMAGENVTKRAIKAYLTKETLKQFQRLMLKVFGVKVLQRAVIAKTVPVIGGGIGGTWNFIEAHLQGRRVIRYFEGEAIGATDKVEAPVEE